MKRQILTLSVFALAGIMAVTGCKKKTAMLDNEGINNVKLTAIIDNENGKTSLNPENMSTSWTPDDKIDVNGVGNTFTTNGGNTFTGSADISSPYVAAYPAGSATAVSNDGSGTVTFSLPQVQTLTVGSFGNGAAPMVGYSSDGGAILFKNVCGGIAITLKSESAVTINKIKIESKEEQVLWGSSYTVNSISDNVLTCSGPTNTEDGKSILYLLNNDSDVVINSEAKTFYAMLPAGLNDDIYTVTVMRGDRELWSKEFNVSSISRNLIRTIATQTIVVEPSVPEGAIAGLFTINSTGGKVYFSQGNLQYIGSAATPYWKFADNQWVCFGDNGQHNAASKPYDRDLFGWGTSGYHNNEDEYNEHYYPWSFSTVKVNETYNYFGFGPSTNMSDKDLTGTSGQYDWGVHNPISNGGNMAGQWRTLTYDEWKYVLTERVSSTVSNKDNARYVPITMTYDGTNKVRGLLLFPDEFEWNNESMGNPPDATRINAGTINSNWKTEDGNKYTLDQFNALTAAGCVFLPAAGWHKISDYISTTNTSGFYWSSTSSSEKNAYYVYFASGNSVSATQTGSRYYGMSVRLVVPAE